MKTKKKRPFWKWLKNRRACQDAWEWARKKRYSTRQCWKYCTVGHWYFWFLQRVNGRFGWPSRNEVIIGVCELLQGRLASIESDRHRKRTTGVLRKLRAIAEGDLPFENLPGRIPFNDTPGTTHSRESRCVMQATNRLRQAVIDPDLELEYAVGFRVDEVFGNAKRSAPEIRRVFKMGKNF